MQPEVQGVFDAMAELSVFSYRWNRSWISASDARIKLACMAGLSICSLKAGWTGMALATLAAGSILLGLVPCWAVFWRQVRVIFCLLLGLILVRGMLVPGKMLVNWGSWGLSWPGLASGAIIAWRLMLIVLLGLILTASTLPSQVRSAVAWYLKPVPFIDEIQVATMIGLLVRFIPVIFTQAAEILTAQQARALKACRNPVRRTIGLALPVFRKVFVSADRLVFAMESRCFSLKRPLTPLATGSCDRLLVFGTASLCLVLLLF